MELKRRGMTVPLHQGDDHERIETLKAELMKATSAVGSPERLMSDRSPIEVAEEYDAFVAEADGRAFKVRVEPMLRKPFRDLEAAHPPRTKRVTTTDAEGSERTTDEVDERDLIGFNIDTMADPLTVASVAYVETPDGHRIERPAEVERFLDGLADPEFSLIFSAAVEVNTQARTFPKAGATSLLGRMSAETSRSLETSD